MPFYIPEISKEKLNDVFFLRLEEVINANNTKIEVSDSYWSRVFFKCIEPYVRTLRDVNRVINTLRFKMAIVAQETCFEDLVAITTLEVLVPALYLWISKNKTLLCGESSTDMFSYSKNNVEIKEKFVNEFKAMGIAEQTALGCIETLFPQFAKITGNSYYQVDDDSNRRQMRIAQPEHFVPYFQLNISETSVSRNEINAILYSYNADELAEVFRKANSTGGIIYLLNELKSLSPKIPKNRIGLLVEILLHEANAFDAYEMKSIFSISAKDKAEYLIEALIKQLNTNEDRFRLIIELLKRCNIHELGTISVFINGLELAYGRLAANGINKDMQLISEIQLLEIEEVFISRIKQISKQVKLYVSGNFRMLIYLWKCFDEINANEYVECIGKDDISCLKYTCRMSGKWSGTNGIGWSFSKNDFNQIKEDHVLKIIEKIDKRILIDSFTELELIQLASFVLNYERDEIEHVSEKAAKQLVRDWRNSLEIK